MVFNAFLFTFISSALAFNHQFSNEPYMNYRFRSIPPSTLNTKEDAGNVAVNYVHSSINYANGVINYGHGSILSPPHHEQANPPNGLDGNYMSQGRPFSPAVASSNYPFRSEFSYPGPQGAYPYPAFPSYGGPMYEDRYNRFLQHDDEWLVPSDRLPSFVLNSPETSFDNGSDDEEDEMESKSINHEDEYDKSEENDKNINSDERTNESNFVTQAGNKIIDKVPKDKNKNKGAKQIRKTKKHNIVLKDQVNSDR